MKNLIITLFSCSVIALGVYSYVSMESDSLREDDFYGVASYGLPAGSPSFASAKAEPVLPVYKGSSSSKGQSMDIPDFNTTISRPEVSVSVSSAVGSSSVNLFGEAGGAVQISSRSAESNRATNDYGVGGMSLLAVSSASGYSNSSGASSPGLSNRLDRMSSPVSALDGSSTLSSNGSVLPPATGGDDDDLIELPLNGGGTVVLLLLSLVYLFYKHRKLALSGQGKSVEKN